MTKKELNEFLEDIDDDAEVKILSICIDDDLVPSDVYVCNYDTERNEVYISPSIIGLKNEDGTKLITVTIKKSKTIEGEGYTS